MPAIVTDPNSLTKDKLRTELRKFDIPLPSPDSRKDVLVQLYTDKILNADRLEFSSDDEVTLTPTTKASKKKLSSAKRATPKKASKENLAESSGGDMDVDNMTDDQLAARLRELGVDVGPILESTRKVYQRKLKKLLLSESVSEETATKPDFNSQSSTLILEQEFSDNDETDVKQVYTSVAESFSAPAVSPREDSYRRRTLRDSPVKVNRSATRSSPKRPPTPSYIRDEVDAGFLNNRNAEAGPSSFRRRDVTTRTLRSTVPSDILAQAKEQPQEKQKKKWFSIWVQLAIVAVVAIFIFLIIQTLEPANKNPIGGIDSQV